ncbi:MAG: hypothetical protein INR73_12350 [Williamsia sp.]|nr:hypothetical protein [Williamsia sp.]
MIFMVAKTAVLAALVRLLWNFALPPALGTNLITYWQALALLVLSRILFGRAPFFTPPGKHPGNWQGGSWRSKWMQMTPEDREKFQEEWRKRWRGH